MFKTKLPHLLHGDMGLSETVKVPVAKIVVPEVRASSRMTPDQLEFFKATVSQVGVVQDPVVRALPDGVFELVAGKSRLEELKARGEAEILCKVLHTDEKTALIMHLAENVARGTVDVISVAKVMDKLKNQGSSVEDLAKVLGKSETWIRRTLQLLDLPDVYQDALKDNRITPTHVYLAARMPTTFEMDSALQTALNLGWNTSIFETYVNNRVAEIEAAKQKAAEMGVAPEIPPAQPEQLVKYKQCLVCGYQKPAETVTIQLVCKDCLDLCRYLVQMLGAPEEAIKTVYSALQTYFGTPQSTATPTQRSKEAGVQP